MYLKSSLFTLELEVYNAVNPNSAIIDFKLINLRLLVNATVCTVILVFTRFIKIFQMNPRSGIKLGARILSIRRAHDKHLILIITL